MKTTPAQLALIAIAGFGALILMQVLIEYRSSEDFRNHLRNLEMGNLLPEMRLRRIAEENMEPTPNPVWTAPVGDGEDSEDGE